MTQTTMPVLEGATAVPDEPVAAAPRPRGGSLKKWWARFTVLLMVAAAVAGGTYLARAKMARSAAAAATFDLSAVTLSATPLPISTLQGGRVSAVDVHAQERVTTGERLGTLLVTSTTATGRTKVTPTAVRAPRAGVVAADPASVGTVLGAGQSLVTLYDPADLVLDVDVTMADLTKLRRGMVATLHADGLRTPVHAVLDRAVPRVGNNQADLAADRVELVLTPSRSSDVATLLPGLQFTGSVDLDSGRGAAGASLLTSA